MDDKGNFKLCDFGISGQLVDSLAKTVDAGCKPYMAVSSQTWEIKKLNTVYSNTRAKPLRMRKVSIFKLAVANANFTTRMPVFELKSNFISIQNFKAGNVNLQVCTGARISRKFAAIVQESRSFRQILASPFSVFMFDFRMKRK